MSLDDNWITEVCEDGGSAFSLKGEHKLFEEQSPYQHVEVFETDTYGNLMLIDGCTMVSTRDNFLYHEMMSHPVLFMHPAPRRVAIIGGGDCGTLREVLKHPEVRHVTQIDIDEAVTRAALAHFPELCEANDDARAELLFIDGIQWMKDAEPGSLDVIIVDSTDPIGPGEVLFTPEFYAACHRALGDDGLVVQQSESPLIHMAVLERMYRSLKAARFSDARTLFFPQPIYPTGWWSATIGAKHGTLGEFRRADVETRHFGTTYYNAAIHTAAFAEPEFFRKARDEWWQTG
ncbi:MAG: polyamine aminopropyltransferase [Gammaproteobacteria bacterium]|nr:polyamine aminopropyltransferase [Gammaproteobacteria bacterium]